jgi:HD-like signal output (HDOD) protein
MNARRMTLDGVCAGAMQLPCSPSLLPRLISVLSGAGSDADEIAAIIRLDPVLAAATLRLANSAYFASTVPADTLVEAVLRLGQGELYRLAALALVSRWGEAAACGEPGDFCRHALCTALAAEVLAGISGRVDPESAYTVGLVSDLGKLALLHACGAAWPELRAYCDEHGCTWREAELAVLGFSHAQVGARLLRTWRFPARLIDATEFWERPEQAPAESQPLAAHLHAGKFVATSCGLGVVDGGFLVQLNPELLLEWGFTPERLQQAMLAVHERAEQRLGVKLTHGNIAF